MIDDDDTSPQLKIDEWPSMEELLPEDRSEEKAHAERLGLVWDD